jgi:uncharacterized protein YjbJ (UPF0337 family)
MDKDVNLRAEGAMDKAAGTVQRAWGDLTNNPEHQVKGATKQAKGELKTKAGRALDAIEDLD